MYPVNTPGIFNAATVMMGNVFGDNKIGVRCKDYFNSLDAYVSRSLNTVKQYMLRTARLSLPVMVDCPGIKAYGGKIASFDQLIFYHLLFHIRWQHNHSLTNKPLFNFFDYNSGHHK
jgi:hypothetical protein